LEGNLASAAGGHMRRRDHCHSRQFYK